MDKKRKIRKLTIAIPVYEREKYFLAALNSAENQTEQCEIVVVDNKSSTKYFKNICSERNIRYVGCTSHVSMFENWNRCFRYAETEYVLILGDDDILANDYVECFLNTLQEFPDIDLYYTDFYHIYNDDGPDKKIDGDFKMPHGYADSGKAVIEYGARYGLGFPSVSCIYRKSKFSGYYSGFHASNDWLWIYSNIDTLKIFGNPQRKMFYRKHEAADTSRGETKIREFLSHAYIYAKVVVPRLKDSNLRRLALKKADRSLLSMKFADPGEEIKKIVNLDNIYSKYLQDTIAESFRLKILFAIPALLVRFLKRIKG